MKWNHKKAHTNYKPKLMPFRRNPWLNAASLSFAKKKKSLKWPVESSRVTLWKYRLLYSLGEINLTKRVANVWTTHMSSVCVCVPKCKKTTMKNTQRKIDETFLYRQRIKFQRCVCVCRQTIQMCPAYRCRRLPATGIECLMNVRLSLSPSSSNGRRQQRNRHSIWLHNSTKRSLLHDEHEFFCELSVMNCEAKVYFNHVQDKRSHWIYHTRSDSDKHHNGSVWMTKSLMIVDVWRLLNWKFLLEQVKNRSVFLPLSSYVCCNWAPFASVFYSTPSFASLCSHSEPTKHWTLLMACDISLFGMVVSNGIVIVGHQHVAVLPIANTALFSTIIY